MSGTMWPFGDLSWVERYEQYWLGTRTILAGHTQVVVRLAVLNAAKQIH